MLKKDKKGFTLAELLIVVAIIAVLTAIAVPLFVGALGNAQDSVDKANMRALRSEAATYILLSNDSNLKDGTSYYPEYTVEGTVSKSGEVKITKITGVKAATTTADSGTDGTYTVYVRVDDLNKADITVVKPST